MLNDNDSRINGPCKTYDLKIKEENKQPFLPVSVRPICPAQSTAQDLILTCFKLSLRISIAWINFISFARATS